MSSHQGEGYPLYSEYNRRVFFAFKVITTHNKVGCIRHVSYFFNRFLTGLVDNRMPDFSYALSIRELAAYRGNNIRLSPVGLAMNQCLDITFTAFDKLTTAYTNMNSGIVTSYIEMFSFFDIPHPRYMTGVLPTESELDGTPVDTMYMWFSNHTFVIHDHAYRKNIHDIYKFLVIHSPNYDPSIPDHYIQAHNEFMNIGDARGHPLFERTFHHAIILWYALGNPYRAPENLPSSDAPFIKTMFPVTWTHICQTKFMRDYKTTRGDDIDVVPPLRASQPHESVRLLRLPDDVDRGIPVHAIGGTGR